jgi:hypothetical protein
MRSVVMRGLFTTGAGLDRAIPMPDEETFRVCGATSGLHLEQNFPVSEFHIPSGAQQLCEWMTTGKATIPTLDLSDPITAARHFIEAEEGRRIAVAEVKELTEEVATHSVEKEELQEQFNLIAATVDVAGHAGVVFGKPTEDDQTRRPKSIEVKKSDTRVVASCPPSIHNRTGGRFGSVLPRSKPKFRQRRRVSVFRSCADPF